MPQSHPDPNSWWFHRRLMAYWAMVALSIALVLAITGLVRDAQAPLVEGICWIFGVVVVSYFTNNAVEALAQSRILMTVRAINRSSPMVSGP